MMSTQMNKMSVLFKRTTLVSVLSVSMTFFTMNVCAKEFRNHSANIIGSNAARSSIEAAPQFPGGMKEFFKFINEHTPWKETTGKTEIVFYINKDGSIDIPKMSLETSDNNKIALFTALAKSPKWRPAVQNGRLMKVGYLLAVTFDTIDQVNVINVDHVDMIKEEIIVSFEKVEQNGHLHIQGSVSKVNGEPLVGVSIWSPGSQQWSGSGIDGKFSIVLSEPAIIKFSCIGHTTKSINL